MTVTYTAEVATVRGFGCFLKLLIRWRGSIYKLVWADLMAFLGIYYVLNLVYRIVLNKHQRIIFESISEYCEKYSDLIPLSFVLGFYVSIVMTRWWDQYNHVPWPDPLAVYVSAHIHGQDERGRLMRRTIMRYSCLCLTIVFSMISPRVKKRFPTLGHFVEAGLLLENEKQIIEDLDEKFPRHAKHWLPIVWAASIVTRARKEGRIRDDFAVKTIIDELNKFRGNCGQLLNYDTISVPLVYTQVVTLAVYSFLLSRIMARQWLDPGRLDDDDISSTESPTMTASTSDRYRIDLYFPIFLTLQFFFYMGWLKVAESLINPFGEDDDDFEVNWLVDRNLQVSYLIVDEMHHDHPELIKDQYWDDVFPTELPYTLASEQFREEVPIASTANIEVAAAAAELAMPPSSVKIEDGNMDNNFIQFDDNSSGIHFFAGPKRSNSRASQRDRDRVLSGSSSSSINTNPNPGSVPASINRAGSVTSILKSLFTRENSNPGGTSTDGGMQPSQSAASLINKGAGTMKLTHQVIEEVDEQLTVQSTRGNNAKPDVRDIFPDSPPNSRPPASVPVDVPLNNLRPEKMFTISSSVASDASPISSSALSAALSSVQPEAESSGPSSPVTLVPKQAHSLSSDDEGEGERGDDYFTKLQHQREVESRRRLAARLARSISAQKAALQGDGADTEALLSDLINQSLGSGSSINKPT